VFKWMKQEGIKHDRYIISVGDVWGGWVEVQRNPVLEDRAETGPTWSAGYTICGHPVSGQSGGTQTRDELMTWVETRIRDALREVADLMGTWDVGGVKQPFLRSTTGRQIVSSLWEKYPGTEELYQKVLE